MGEFCGGVCFIFYRYLNVLSDRADAVGRICGIPNDLIWNSKDLNIIVYLLLKIIGEDGNCKPCT